MKFMFTCGGTAGHINPALAVAGRLRELMPDCEILFVGADGHMETDLVPRGGYDIVTLKVTNISRSKSLKGIIHNIKSIINVIVSTIKAKKIVKNFKPDIVVGTGGYVCYPVLKAAAKLGIPTVVHESNAFPGLTTRMLESVVDKILLGFEESKQHYKHPDKLIVTGTPVRGQFGQYTKNSAKAELGIDVNTPLVVSVWGSLGASHMNEAMCEFIRLAGDNAGFKMIHSAGTAGYETMVKTLKEIAPDYEKNGMDVREYIYDMPQQMAAADIVICRAGAMTVSELALDNKCAIFIPSPNVAENHQYKNAKVLVDAGASLVYEEKYLEPLDAKPLTEKVEYLLSEAGAAEREKMEQSIGQFAVRDANERIYEDLMTLIKK